MPRSAKVTSFMLTTRACGCKSLNFSPCSRCFCRMQGSLLKQYSPASWQDCFVFQLNDTNWACCFFEGSIAVYDMCHLLLPYCYLYASALRKKRQVAFHYDARRPWHAWPQGAIFLWVWLIFRIDRSILNFDLGTQQFWCVDMSGTCDPSPTQTRKRDDFTGFVGLAFVTQLTSAGLFQKLASNCRITWKHTCSFEGFKLPRHSVRKI